jgi:hypothetical protein
LDRLRREATPVWASLSGKSHQVRRQFALHNSPGPQELSPLQNGNFLKRFKLIWVVQSWLQK